MVVTDCAICNLLRGRSKIRLAPFVRLILTFLLSYIIMSTQFSHYGTPLFGGVGGLERGCLETANSRHRGLASYLHAQRLHY